MRRIAADEALQVLATWSQAGAPIRLAMSRSEGQRSDGAVVDQVLPHSRKARLTLRDENGEDVGVTMSLEGADWEYADSRGAQNQRDEGTGAARDLGDRGERRILVATFPNGSRYAFEEQSAGA